MKETVKSLSEKLDRVLKRSDMILQWLVKKLDLDYQDICQKLEIEDVCDMFQELKKIQEKKGDANNGVFKPKKGELCYIVGSEENEIPIRTIVIAFDPKKIFHSDCVDMGEFFRTKEQAQAAIDLRKHIYKFPMAKGDIEFYLVGDTPDEKGFVKFWGSNNPLLIKIDYHSGVSMHPDTTEEDRKERLRLLKLSYNTK